MNSINTFADNINCNKTKIDCTITILKEESRKCVIWKHCLKIVIMKIMIGLFKERIPEKEPDSTMTETNNVKLIVIGLFWQ